MAYFLKKSNLKRGIYLQIYESFYNHAFSISNLGKLALNAAYGDLRLVSFYGPLLDSNPEEVVVGIATANETLTFTMTFRDTILEPSTAKQIRDSALAQFDGALA